MRKLAAAVTALTLIGAATGNALPGDQVHGNARAGREFVGHNCDACHAVAADQDIRPLVSGYAPSFSDIANRPDTTAETLRASSTGSMPTRTCPIPI